VGEGKPFDGWIPALPADAALEVGLERPMVVGKDVLLGDRRAHLEGEEDVRIAGVGGDLDVGGTQMGHPTVRAPVSPLEAAELEIWQVFPAPLLLLGVTPALVERTFRACHLNPSISATSTRGKT